MVRKFLPPPEGAEDPKVPSQTVTQSQILTQEPTNLFPQTLSGAPDDDIAETDGLRGQRQLTTGIGAGREQAVCINPWREGEVNSTPEIPIGNRHPAPPSARDKTIARRRFWSIIPPTEEHFGLSGFQKDREFGPPLLHFIHIIPPQCHPLAVCLATFQWLFRNFFFGSLH